MELNRSARKYYTLELSATDSSGQTITGATGYEASFDDGATWHVGTQDGVTGYWQWLVAGPLADPTGTVAVVTTPWVTPVVRLTDNPEIEAENMPRITLQNP